MERPQKSIPKITKAKNKKKPIKVVYFSNPMRVMASESEFLPLVQKLTGRDSDVAENMGKYSAMTESSQNAEQAPDQADHAISTPSLNCGVDDTLEFQLDWEYKLSDWRFEVYPRFWSSSAIYEHQGDLMGMLNQV